MCTPQVTSFYFKNALTVVTKLKIKVVKNHYKAILKTVLKQEEPTLNMAVTAFY